MKKKHLAFVTALALCLGLLSAPAFGAGSGPVTIDRAAFPDDSFRTVVESLPGAEDGVFTVAELKKITVLRCDDRDITSLEGVKSFPGLEVLTCAGNHLNDLNVSGLSALKELDCSRNFTLKILNARDCPSLTRLNCTRNVLTRLDLRGDTALEKICCGANFLPELNVSAMPRLRELYCNENELIDLDVSQNPSLTDLDCSFNYMREVDVSQNRQLDSLMADFMSHDMTLWVPAEGMDLTGVLDLSEPPMELTGGTLDKNGLFTFDEGVDSASFLYMRNTVTLRKPMNPVTENCTDPSGVTIVVTTDHRGRQYADLRIPEGWQRGYVTVPMHDGNPGTVAVIDLNEAGEKLIRTSYPVKDGLRFPVEQDMRVKLSDRTRRFYDAPNYEWFRPYVDFVSARKLFDGVSHGEFGPDVPMTRAMLVVVLHALEEREPAVEGLSFSDVAEGTWYANAVARAAERGIVSGYPDGRFGPDDSITREQLALMLYRALGSPKVREELLPFCDSASVSPYALTAIRWAVQNGVLSGVGENRLNPGGTASRAEAAAMLMAYVRQMG